MNMELSLSQMLTMFISVISGAFAVCYMLIRGKLGGVFRSIDDCDKSQRNCDLVRIAEAEATQQHRAGVLDRFDKLEKTIDINFKYLLDKIIELKESK